MVIFRAYKKNIVSELELNNEKWFMTPESIFRTCLSWEPLMSVRAAIRKLKVVEIPGDEPERIGGERKLKILKWGAG
jgi:hypothetical protein|tara:strand:- start:3801 stop:4031 length:231 start_codon:yes stop_codon:yes gene_type:complete